MDEGAGYRSDRLSGNTAGVVEPAMKIGLIADIHANLPALEAVFADFPKLDSVVCAGDVVGYYAHVNEVCAFLRERRVWTIRGNHDAFITGEMAPDAELSPVYRCQWTRREILPDHYAWLCSLPVEIVFQWRGNRIRVRHASPGDEQTYLYPDAPQLADVRVAKDEILVVGHTHRPMRMRCGDGWLVNPGSVGQPRDWDPRASYAIVEVETLDVEFRRVEYDVPSLQARLKAQGWDAKMVALLSRERMT
jgi:putative phosphoesterase